MKLIFYYPKLDFAERMWVHVMAQEGLRYTGSIASVPFVNGPLEFNDLIAFERHHIIDINRTRATSA